MSQDDISALKDLANRTLPTFVTPTLATLVRLHQVVQIGLKNRVKAWVESAQSTYQFDINSTATPTGDSVLGVAGTTRGRWFKIANEPSPSASAQTTWNIDPLNGSNENDGSVAHPLKTRDEVFRRLGPGWVLRALAIVEQGTTWLHEKEIPLFGIDNEVTTWWIDPAGAATPVGNDANDGLTQATPLRTWAKLNEKIGSTLRKGATINCLSDAGDISLFLLPGVRSDTSAPTLTINAVASVLDTGTLSNPATFNVASNLPPQVTAVSAATAALGTYIGAPFSYVAGSVTAKAPDGFVTRDAGGGTVNYGGNDSTLTPGTSSYTVWAQPAAGNLVIEAPGVVVNINNFKFTAMPLNPTVAQSINFSGCQFVASATINFFTALPLVTWTNCIFRSANNSTLRSIQMSSPQRSNFTLTGCCFIACRLLLPSVVPSYIINNLYFEGGGSLSSSGVTFCSTTIGIWRSTAGLPALINANEQFCEMRLSQVLGTNNSPPGIFGNRGARISFTGVGVANLTTKVPLSTSGTYVIALSQDGTQTNPTVFNQFPQTREVTGVSTGAGTMTLTTATIITAGDQLTYFGGGADTGTYTATASSSGTSVSVTPSPSGGGSGGTLRIVGTRAPLSTVAHLAGSNFNGMCTSPDGSRIITS